MDGHINSQEFYRGRPFVGYTTRKETVTKYGPWDETQIRVYFRSRQEVDDSGPAPG
jgi:hypothetical protein